MGILKKYNSWALGNYEKLLCCPSFDPQITGGVADPGDVTAKVSVRHWPIFVTSMPSARKIINYRMLSLHYINW